MKRLVDILQEALIQESINVKYEEAPNRYDRQKMARICTFTRKVNGKMSNDKLTQQLKKDMLDMVAVSEKNIKQHAAEKSEELFRQYEERTMKKETEYAKSHFKRESAANKYIDNVRKRLMDNKRIQQFRSIDSFDVKYRPGSYPDSTIISIDRLKYEVNYIFDNMYVDFRDHLLGWTINFICDEYGIPDGNGISRTAHVEFIFDSETERKIERSRNAIDQDIHDYYHGPGNWRGD